MARLPPIIGALILLRTVEPLFTPVRKVGHLSRSFSSAEVLGFRPMTTLNRGLDYSRFDRFVN